MRRFAFLLGERRRLPRPSARHERPEGAASALAARCGHPASAHGPGWDHAVALADLCQLASPRRAESTWPSHAPTPTGRCWSTILGAGCRARASPSAFRSRATASCERSAGVGLIARAACDRVRGPPSPPEARRGPCAVAGSAPDRRSRRPRGPGIAATKVVVAEHAHPHDHDQPTQPATTYEDRVGRAGLVPHGRLDASDVEADGRRRAPCARHARVHRRGAIAPRRSPSSATPVAAAYGDGAAARAPGHRDADADPALRRRGQRCGEATHRHRPADLCSVRRPRTARARSSGPAASTLGLRRALGAPMPWRSAWRRSPCRSASGHRHPAADRPTARHCRPSSEADRRPVAGGLRGPRLDLPPKLASAQELPGRASDEPERVPRRACSVLQFGDREASMRAREKAVMGRPGTISQPPPATLRRERRDQPLGDAVGAIGRHPDEVQSSPAVPSDPRPHVVDRRAGARRPRRRRGPR